MTVISEIEEAVATLSREDLSAFRDWFQEFDAEAWDKQFEDDVAAGRLDALAYEDIELHDANLKSTTVDYVSQTVVLEIDYYLSEQSRARIAATFKFSGVSTYNENSSIDELKKHSIFGNVSYWTPAIESGTTYIYLARGFISITAMGLEVINHT